MCDVQAFRANAGWARWRARLTSASSPRRPAPPGRDGGNGGGDGERGGAGTAGGGNRRLMSAEDARDADADAAYRRLYDDDMYRGGGGGGAAGGGGDGGYDEYGNLVLFLPPAQCERGLTQWTAGVKMCVSARYGDTHGSLLLPPYSPLRRERDGDAAPSPVRDTATPGTLSPGGGPGASSSSRRFLPHVSGGGADAAAAFGPLGGVGLLRGDGSGRLGGGRGRDAPGDGDPVRRAARVVWLVSLAPSASSRPLVSR